MAISSSNLGKSASSTGTSQNLSVTVPAGTQFLVICVFINGNAVTVNSVTGTGSGSSQLVRSPTTNPMHSELWRLNAPSSGSQTITVNVTNAGANTWGFSVAAYQGVDGSTPFGTPNSGYVSIDSFTSSIAGGVSGDEGIVCYAGSAQYTPAGGGSDFNNNYSSTFYQAQKRYTTISADPDTEVWSRANNKTAGWCGVIVKASTLTAVGNSLNSTWNIIAEVGASKNSTWNDLNVVGQSLNGTWNDLVSVGQSQNSTWNIIAEVGASLNGTWNVLTIGRRVTEVYAYSISNDPRARVTQIYSYSIHGPNARRVTEVYAYTVALEDLGTQVEKSIDLVWNTYESVSKSFDANWNVLESVGNSLNSTWNISNSVSKSVDIRWNVLTSVSKSFDLVWDSGYSQVIKSVDLRWNSGFSQVEKSFDLLWDSGYSQVYKSANLRWNVYNAVAKSVSFRWNTYQFVSVSRDLRWNNATDVIKTFDLLWGVVPEIEVTQFPIEVISHTGNETLITHFPTEILSGVVPEIRVTQFEGEIFYGLIPEIRVTHFPIEILIPFDDCQLKPPVPSGGGGPVAEPCIDYPLVVVNEACSPPIVADESCPANMMPQDGTSTHPVLINKEC